MSEITPPIWLIYIVTCPILDRVFVYYNIKDIMLIYIQLSFNILNSIKHILLYHTD